MKEGVTMLQRLDGRVWHGDHLIDAATQAGIARLIALEDGDDPGTGLVHRVREFASEVDGAVMIHGFDLSDPRKAAAEAPLGQLADAPTIEAPRSRPATVRVVSLEAPSDLDDATRMRRELLLDSGVALVTVRWGSVATWVPAEPSNGAPATTVESALLVALAPADRVVPSIADALASLGDGKFAPGGERGQRLRETGRTWASVPEVEVWEGDAADAWVLGGLLERAADPRDLTRSSLLGAPIPRITTLMPGGAPVLVASAGGGLVSRTTDRLLTLWEGRDEGDRTVAVAVHRSAAQSPALDLPLWPGQRPTDPPDGWCGEVMEYEDEPGYVDRYRFRVTPIGRLRFPSRRIVASDPCVAGRSSALGLDLPGEGPFAVLRVDLMDVTHDGTELDRQARGILLVLDEGHPPVRWEAAQDAEGQPIVCVIDTGQLLLGDAEGSNEVQRQYDEGTAQYGSQARLSLRRSDARRPADIAVLADLGGDGPGWVVVGSAEDDRPVAVLVANFDPLA
jgi:hypothetical protein